MNILFYTPLCPDCPPFIDALEKKGIAYEPVEITASMKNLRQFLAVRDSKAAFDPQKALGYAGIPCLYTEAGQCIFTIDELDNVKP